MNSWINEDRVKYFDLMEYVDKIKLSDSVLFHLDDVNNNFEKYIKSLCNSCDFNESNLIYYWLDRNYKELYSSSKIENQSIYFENDTLLDSGISFHNTKLTEKEIKNIHKFVCGHSKTHKIIAGEYRKDIAWVGSFDENNKPIIYWYGAEAEEIPQFMKSFVDFYNKNGISNIYSNPFIKSALVHLLLVRIHPFSDGNGRTARILHDVTFTSNINKLYGTKLKLPPLNISGSIKVNRLSYADTINKIHFNLEDDNNKDINRWLNFILNMYDEQIYYLSTKLPELENKLKYFDGENINDQEIIAMASNSKVKKLY